MCYRRLQKRIKIPSFRGHCVISICDRDYSRHFGNILSLEALRISVSVVTLMVAARTYAEIRELGYTSEYLSTESGMLLDSGEFLGCKLALFCDYTFGDTDLSYIMEQSRIIYLVTFFIALAVHLGKPSRIFRHSRGMTVSVLILRVYGICECCDDLFSKGLKTEPCSLDLGDIIVKLFVKLLTVHGGKVDIIFKYAKRGNRVGIARFNTVIL